jgi:hypothetical protein
MSKLDLVVAIFHTHAEAEEEAVKELHRAGTDIISQCGS